MPSEQVKGTLLAVGATAASTAFLVGGIVGYNQIQVVSAADEQAIVFNEAHSVRGATDALTGATRAFSDHCTVMREGLQFTVGPMSYTTSNTSLHGTPVPPSRSETGFDWQWTNKTRISPIGVRPEAPGIVGTTPQNVSTPAGRTQENLNAWYQQIWDSGFKVGSVEKNNQPGDWGKYLINNTVSDGWAADNEVVELPKAPSPSPSTTPSTPAPETPGTQPPTPTGNETPAPTPTSEPPAPQKPSASLAHTGTTLMPLVGMSVFLLAGGAATVLRKRNSI